MGYSAVRIFLFCARLATVATALFAVCVPLNAQIACDCAAILPDGSCSCPGCDAFFSSVDKAMPAVDPQVDSETPPPVVDPLVQDTPPSTVGTPDINQLATGNFASTFGSVAGGVGVPSMIGDFFGGGFSYLQFPGSGFTNGTVGQNAIIAAAGGDRQLKWAENNSPFPQNRVFFNYHHFHNAVIGADSLEHNLDRFTFGIEKTFLGGDASFEVRVPFASTVTSSPSIFDTSRVMDTEFGNISFALKALLHRQANFATSVGLGIVVPTGDDFVVDSFINNRFENGEVHLQPFLGVYYAPSRRVFTQFFTQLDFDAGESEVVIGSQSDSLNQQTLLMLDYAVGYWLTRGRRGCIRGIAPLVELHYTTTLEDQEYGVYSGQGVFVEDLRRDVLNLTGGLFFQLGRASSMKVGAVAPLRDGTDKLFDSEFGLQFVRNF